MCESTARPFSINSYPTPIVHIDADAFFTSVEQALHPELQGKPVVTGKERGIVACASYEAKALGVKRPMQLYKARQALPNLICLPSDYETYSLYSKRMFAIVRRFTPIVEEYSIDEAFAELSGIRRIHRTGYPEIAKLIQKTVNQELGLTVSVGLSISKTLAKLASKENKPNGFLAVPAREIHHYLKGMPLERVCGFGPNTVSLLQKRGIKTVLDYARTPEGWAKGLLGKIGDELWRELRGEAVHPVRTEEQAIQYTVSKTKTFTPPSSVKEFVCGQLIRNTESACIKLRRHNLRAKRVAIYLRNQEFHSKGVEAELDRSTSSTIQMGEFVQRLFEKVFDPKTCYRSTTVFLSKLEIDDSIQYSLFETPAKIESMRAIDKVIDTINTSYGKHTVHLGSTLWLGKHRQHVADRGDLPKRKTELLPGETLRQRLGMPMWGVKV